MPDGLMDLQCSLTTVRVSISTAIYTVRGREILLLETETVSVVNSIKSPPEDKRGKVAIQHILAKPLHGWQTKPLIGIDGIV
jgi:hypothetical protein